MKVVGHYPSLHLKGTWFEIIELTLEAKNALVRMVVVLLVVCKSLRKWTSGYVLNCIKEENVDLHLEKGLPILSLSNFTLFPSID